jgi:WD40 repeat protein
MKITPDGLSLAIGDRHGNIRIFDLELFQQIALVEAHDSEVLSIDYGQSIDMGSCAVLTVKHCQRRSIF